MTRESVLLLLLKYMGYINGRVMFQKLLFLLEKNYHIITGYDFVPFKYGPYCQAIQKDLHRLNDYGYIDHEELTKNDNEILHRYQLTEIGEQQLLENEIPHIYDQVVQDICYDFKNYSVRQLVEYVYENYPEYTVHSEIIEQFKPKPKQEEFTSADMLLDHKPIIVPSFVNWLDEEINKATKRLGISNEPLEKKVDDLEVDDLIIEMLYIAYEDIMAKTQEVSTQLMVENYSEAGEINNKCYFIMDIMDKLLGSLQEGDVIGLYTEFANTRTNLQMLDELIALHRASLHSDLVRLLFEFIEDIRYLLDSIDHIVYL